MALQAGGRTCRGRMDFEAEQQAGSEHDKIVSLQPSDIAESYKLMLELVADVFGHGALRLRMGLVDVHRPPGPRDLISNMASRRMPIR